MVYVYIYIQVSIGSVSASASHNASPPWPVPLLSLVPACASPHWSCPPWLARGAACARQGRRSAAAAARTDLRGRVLERHAVGQHVAIQLRNLPRRHRVALRQHLKLAAEGPARQRPKHPGAAALPRPPPPGQAPHSPCLPLLLAASHHRPSPLPDDALPNAVPFFCFFRAIHEAQVRGSLTSTQNLGVCVLSISCRSAGGSPAAAGRHESAAKRYAHLRLPWSRAEPSPLSPRMSKSAHLGMRGNRAPVCRSTVIGDQRERPRHAAPA